MGSCQDRCRVTKRPLLLSFCETQPSLKKITPKLARQESSPMPTTRHTSTRQRKNTEKDAEALPHLARILSYMLIKGGIRLESITAEWVHRMPQPRLPGSHHQLRSSYCAYMTRSLARDSVFFVGIVSFKRDLTWAGWNSASGVCRGVVMAVGALYVYSQCEDFFLAMVSLHKNSCTFVLRIVNIEYVSMTTHIITERYRGPLRHLCLIHDRGVGTIFSTVAPVKEIV